MNNPDQRSISAHQRFFDHRAPGLRINASRQRTLGRRENEDEDEDDDDDEDELGHSARINHGDRRERPQVFLWRGR